MLSTTQVVCVLCSMHIECTDYILGEAKSRVAFDLVGGAYVGTYSDIHTVRSIYYV